MTKKDYASAAKRVREIGKHDYVHGVPNANQVAEFLADWFDDENPKFNRGQFLSACCREK